MRLRWLNLLAVSAFIFTSSPAPTAAEDTPDPNQAHYRNGDLVAPLPADPAVRARVLAEVEAAARQRLASRPDVKYLPPARVVGTASPVRAPMRVVDTSGSAAGLRELEAIWERIDSRGHDDAAATELNAPAVADRVLEIPAGGQAPAGVILPQNGFDDTGRIPASPDIAVGLTRVVIVVNARFQVRDRCGSFLIDGSLGGYFGVPGDFTVYDPVCVFDEWNNRFLIAFQAIKNATNQSRVYLAVSDDETASSWFSYPLQFADAGNFNDDISLGVSPSGIYITGNEFDFTNFLPEGATLLELDKSTVYAQGIVTLHTRRNLTHGNASQALSLRPAQMHSYPGAVYFMAARVISANFVTLYTLTGPPGFSSFSPADVVTGTYDPAPNVQQPDLSLIRMPDCRVSDAVYDAGYVYATQTVKNSISVTDASVRVFRITTASLAHIGTFLSAPPSSFYPSIDVDLFGHIGLFYNTVGTAKFLEGNFLIFDLGTLTLDDAGTAFVGQANYTAGSAPYRWGNHTGIARDPLDDRTFWMHGAHAANTPIPSWETKVYTIGGSSPANLIVTPTSSNFAGGVEGGPFSPGAYEFHLENNGGGVVSWKITSYPSWTTPAILSGTLSPYTSVDIVVPINDSAMYFPAGLYTEAFQIQNCTGFGGWADDLSLAVGQANCPGSWAGLHPPDAFPTLLENNQEPGVFVTAIEEVPLCAVGISAVLTEPALATVNIKEANGTTAGTLVYSSSALLYSPFGGFHFVPVAFTLEECQEYHISIHYDGVWQYDAFDENLIYEPIDGGGLIRARDGSEASSATPDILPPMMAIVQPETCDSTSVLTGYNSFDTVSSGEVGAFITSHGTRRLCAVGIDVSGSPGARVFASLSSLPGGEPVAFGTAVIPGGGIQEVVIPASGVMVAGEDYLLQIGTFGTTDVAVWLAKPVPYTVDYTEVTGGAASGSPDPDVPAMTLYWTNDPNGFPLDMQKPGPSPTFPASGSLVGGIYVTSMIDQELYSLGVLADIPAGTAITMNVYEATGTTRGALITSGTAESEGSGERFHDVPCAVTLKSGGEYDFEVSIGTLTEAKFWDDASGLPYLVGTFQVTDAESFGSTSATELYNFRVRVCNTTLVPVLDGPVHTPMYLANPVPNPAGDEVRFGYTIEETGPAELAIYDVAGRLVDRVFRETAAAIGSSEVSYRTSHLPSGVYFAKLTSPGRSVTRKFVIAH